MTLKVNENYGTFISLFKFWHNLIIYLKIEKC